MQVHNVEQNSQEWQALRAGIPTASSFSKLISGTGKESESLNDYARHLGIEIYTGMQSNNFAGNYHTKRGHELEPVAVNEYAFINDVEPIEIGFITDDNETMGTSPDRLIGDDGLLEIKCLSDKEHYLVLEKFKDTQDIPPKYKPQLQGEMMISERKWVDICFFHPSMPSLTHRVYPDEIYTAKLKKQIKKCLIQRDEIVSFLKSFSNQVEKTEQQRKLIIEV